jgi:hypothetical protein
MSLRQFTNNAATTLATAISSTATSLSVTSGAGALFPALSAGQYFTATISKAGTPTTFEIVLVQGRSTDTFSPIVRAQEGTTALAWNAGDNIALLTTAGDMASFAQFDDLQAQSGNYAADTGTANAYAVALTPALTAHRVGMPIRWLAAHSNTGASTFTDGVGAAALTYQDGSALAANTVIAGGIYTSIWTGSKFQLAAADFSAYATLADLTPLAPLASPAFTGTPTAPTAAIGTNNTQIATMAALYARCPVIKTGAFTCVNGTVTVTFATPFSSVCDAAVVQWEYSTPDVGFVVPGSRTVNGFQYTNGNSGACTYIAVGY